MTEPGPLGEEAARLFGAAQQWLHRVALDPATAKLATGSAECCWCPLCQLIAAARGERGELADRLAEAMAAMTDLQRALAGLLRSVTEPTSDRPARDGAGPDRPAHNVQKIDLSGQPAGEEG
ncbi:MAG: hypothetical protein ACJ74U_12770 [Jatrophihabitantaceae bacterium]